ncbi:MAG: PQQ-dependent sugar dehydrogenase, partial [Gammaproteobacteria bacterium]|nr:PQQ-dependent sugar dehydrogenase [Gammaproteobacteria bacterium]
MAAAQPALAQQGNIKKLLDFKTTGTALDLETVPQEGDRAEALKKIAARVKLPPGFKISLYAVVPDARHMAVGNNVGTVFVGTRKTAVWAVTDRDRNRVADEVKRFAPSVAMTVPNGVCFSKDGFLYIAEHNRLLIYPAAEFFYEGPDVAIGVVKEPLIPPDEESFNHGARTCAIGPDDMIYITQGQPYNVQPVSKLDFYDKYGIGAVVRMNRWDGTNWEVYARGVRNSVGLAFNPANGELWFTDNQVDGMGDLIPPGELNRVTSAGQHFGFPWYGGGKTRTNEYKDSEPPADAFFPEVEMDAHAADLGMTFYTGKMFPAKYRGGIFSAQHGSWN